VKKNLEETIEHMLFHCEFSTSCWDTLNLHWQQNGTRLQIIEKGEGAMKKIDFYGGLHCWILVHMERKE
jgi:hypothetical protein